MLCQNVSLDKYEIICIDDGSKDRSAEILDEYAKNYSNVKVVHKENEGVSVARNLGIDISQGEYIWFVDCDDAIRNNCLKQIFNKMEKNSPEVFRVGVKFIYFESKLDFVGEEIEFIRKKESQMPVNAWAMIIRRNIIAKNSLYFRPDLKIGEDTIFCSFLYTFQKGDCILIKNELYLYRQNPMSVTHDLKNRDVFIKDSIKRAKILREEILLLCKDTAKRNVIIESSYFTISSALFRFPESSLDYNEIMQQIKSEGLYPYPFFHSGLKRKEGFKAFCRELARSFFRFEWIYKIYFKAKRKRFNKRNK